MTKNIEVQVYTQRTGSPGFFSVSPVKLFWWIFAAVVAVVGFVMVDPLDLVSKITDVRLWSLYSGNKEMHKTIDQVKRSVDNAEQRLEETQWLRDKVTEMAGVSSAEPKTRGKEESERYDTPVKNLLRIRKAHTTFKNLLVALQDNPNLAANLPMIHPLRDHSMRGNTFGIVQDKFTETDLPHRGLDFLGQEGDTVIAPGGGLVGMVQSTGGFGLTLTLIHTEGVETFYAHLNAVLVQQGKSVKRGQPIAILGRTGRVSGPLLHYEIRVNDTPLNPEDYFITP